MSQTKSEHNCRAAAEAGMFRDQGASE